MTEKTKRIIKRRVLIALMIIFIVGFTGYLFAVNFIMQYELEQQKSQIVQKIEEQKIRSNQLDEQVKQIGSKSYVEFVARKYLGLYYPDEVIVVSVDADKTGVSK
ncbi:MAG: septum formation initiator family protein [Eubacteriaceae bacterium]|nr:septum formation initiator family protein [Eubacteriaceae bacterium]